MRWMVIRILRRGVVGLTLVTVLLLAVRVWESQRGAPLERWHTYVPHDLGAQEIDQIDWAGYLKAEAALFDRLRTDVTLELDEDERVPFNRYFDGSPVYPGRFAHDWNRSSVLEPDGPPVGAVVFLHGLTDSPYSSRSIARRYRAHGYVSIAIRLPGHGTVPGALTRVEWEDWLAATRLAVREARRRTGPSRPLHIVGYSTGGALALEYALDALGDQTLARPDRVVLISPMIGITRFARFAGFAGLPAMLPAFARAAWLSILPEFNPFKYNSFPVNGARQSHLLTVALQGGIARYAGENRLDELPPILTFQSVIDFTVSTRAVISALYVHVPRNGSELVLFDLNRSAKFGPLLRPAAEAKVRNLLPEPPRRFRTTVVTNAGPGASEAVARVVEAGDDTEQSTQLGLSYPDDVYSLSHIALPFPTSDPLYGLEPDTSEDFGINLGNLAARGEHGTLIVSLGTLLRLSSNPFFPYLLERIEEGIVASGGSR